MPRLSLSLRNPVAIEVKERPWNHPQPSQPTLLARLALRYRQQIPIAVGMATQLKPLIELTVVGEQSVRGHPKPAT